MVKRAAALILVLLYLGRHHQPAQAQTPQLTPYQSVEGEMRTAGDSQTWQFTAIEGAMVSIHATSADTFDPVLTLSNSSGTALMSNDDYNYPESLDAMLEGITLPRTDTYTVTVSGANETVGTYTLTLNYGYSEAVLVRPIDVAVNWEESTNAVTVIQADGIAAVTASGANSSGYVSDTLAEAYNSFHVRVEIVEVSGRSGWVTGLALRANETRRYVVQVNQRGQWRLVRQDSNSERIVRDWTAHPAIRAGETRFALGVLVNRQVFDVFYNDAFVGQAVDRQVTASESGVLGLYVGAPDALDATATAQFGALYVTVPAMNADARVIPQQLMAGSLGLTVQELERRGVIQGGGEQVLSVAESNGRQIQSGVNRIVLGRAAQFERYVLSTTFTAQADSDGVTGCGLLFGHTSDESHGVAYLDRTGAYGMSLRDGAAYQPGLFGESQNPAWQTGRQHLLIVRLNDRIHYYVNRQYVGTVTAPAASGQVGNVVVNYDPVNTFCQFNDTWVWRLP